MEKGAGDVVVEYAAILQEFLNAFAVTREFGKKHGLGTLSIRGSRV
ncbi:hypothetical protein ABT009_11490 [Streptomyces sp. NPDC002896]